jgi:hypothetical protein
MSTHTPVPWEIYPDGDRRHVVRAGSVRTVTAAITQAEWIAELDPDATEESQELTEANASYIVTACNAFPDLLEAVNLLLAAIAFAEVNKHPAIDACLDYATAAVAKAKGET